MKWHTGLSDPNPEEIHRTGLEEIALMRPKVMALASRLGYKSGQVRTMKQLFNKVAAEPGQVFKVRFG